MRRRVDLSAARRVACLPLKLSGWLDLDQQATPTHTPSLQVAGIPIPRARSIPVPSSPDPTQSAAAVSGHPSMAGGSLNVIDHPGLRFLQKLKNAPLSAQNMFLQEGGTPIPCKEGVSLGDFPFLRGFLQLHELEVYAGLCRIILRACSVIDML